MKDSLPTSLEGSAVHLRANCMMECERDESALAPVTPVDRDELASSANF